MKKTLLFSTLISVLCAVNQLNAATFTSSLFGGNWSNPTTWTITGATATTGTTPGSADDVILGVSPTFIAFVTLDVPGITVANLIVNKSVLSGNKDLTITGNLTMNTINSVIGIVGQLTISGNLIWIGGTIGPSNSNDRSYVTISGTANITVGFGNFCEARYSTITLLNGGSLNGYLALNTAQFYIPFGTTFNVSGLLSTFGGSGTGGVNLVGTINSTATQLGFFVQLNNNLDGIVNVAPNTTLAFFAGSFTTLTNFTSFGSGSTLLVSGGVVTLAASLTTFDALIKVTSGILEIYSPTGLNYSNSNFINSGALIGNTFNFNGPTQQTITGTGTIQTVNLNNPNDLIITDALTITNLNLLSGKVQLNAGNLTVGTITGANASQYIKTNSTGNLKQTVGSTSILFPVGKSNYTPITINQASGTDVYAVRVNDGIAATHPLIGTAYVGKEWDISRTAGSTIPATVKAEWNASDEGIGFNCAAAQLLHYNGTVWEALPISGKTVSCATIPRSLTQTGVTAFSPFAVGVAATVLSVELIDFQAVKHNSAVDLLWQTAAEKDMSHFDIEQSTDGKNYSKIGQTKAAGKANNYIFTPEGPLSILAYFRLKIVNTDGSFTYSKVISVSFGKNLTVKAFPNPVTNDLTVDAFSDAKSLDFSVLDVLGRSVYQKKEQNTEGPKSLTINTLGWSSGIYFLSVSDGKNVFQQKIVKR
jgi:Secretion system C-terminal sorting domain